MRFPKYTIEGDIKPIIPPIGAKISTAASFMHPASAKNAKNPKIPHIKDNASKLQPFFIPISPVKITNPILALNVSYLHLYVNILYENKYNL